MLHGVAYILFIHPNFHGRVRTCIIFTEFIIKGSFYVAQCPVRCTTVAKGDSNPGSLDCESCVLYTTELPRSTIRILATAKHVNHQRKF